MIFFATFIDIKDEITQKFRFDSGMVILEIGILVAIAICSNYECMFGSCAHYCGQRFHRTHHLPSMRPNDIIFIN